MDLVSAEAARYIRRQDKQSVSSRLFAASGLAESQVGPAFWHGLVRVMVSWNQERPPSPRVLR
jgi:hypothetical protein